jgi:hypothetical protein
MYPMRDTVGLDSFLLLKDSGECCFGGKPALQDMIGVVMEEGQTVDFSQGRVSVAGVFELNEEYDPMLGDSLQPIFMLRASFFEPSRTAY